MENYKVKVSVIMPVYNSGRYLKTAIECILNQSLREIELILVDDGSTDGSSEVCDKYASNDNRIVVIHERNSGICNARNAALNIAKGEYIGFSDHDDEISQEAYEKAYRYAKENDLDLARFGHWAIKKTETAILKKWEFKFPDRIYKSEDVGNNYLNMLLLGQMECVWDGLYRNDYLSKNHIRFDGNRFKSGGEDVDFNGRVVSFKPKIGTMSEVFYMHNIRIGFSTSSKFSEIIVNNALEFPHRLNEYLAAYNPQRIYASNPDIYAEALIHRTAGTILYWTSTKACNYSNEKKYTLLNMVRNDNEIYSIFYKASKVNLVLKSIKYGILYIAFTNGWFKYCQLLYCTRNLRDAIVVCKQKTDSKLSEIIHYLRRSQNRITNFIKE